jgi:hypothetical protein
MLYEINSVYCSRCKEFTSIFDATNLNFSSTELICSTCGKILLVMKTKMQTKFDSSFSSKQLENYVKKENQKTAKELSMNSVVFGTNTA